MHCPARLQVPPSGTRRHEQAVSGPGNMNAFDEPLQKAAHSAVPPQAPRAPCGA